MRIRNGVFKLKCRILTVKEEEADHDVRLCPPCWTLTPGIDVWKSNHLTWCREPRCNISEAITNTVCIQGTHGLPIYAIWFQSKVRMEKPSPLWYLKSETEVKVPVWDESYSNLPKDLVDLLKAFHDIRKRCMSFVAVHTTLSGQIQHTWGNECLVRL